MRPNAVENSIQKVKLIRAQVDALALEPKKDVTSCDKLLGRANINDPQISEWGNPAEKTSVIHTPIHNVWRGTGELKHLSTGGRERNIDFLSSGERKGKEPKLQCVLQGNELHK